ncbi:MAG TPA: AraC family transcriptional regulator [Opitutaceae bacterium]|nr:AraC family transcriptional regulator [Opitutaceae bacterium]
MSEPLQFLQWHTAKALHQVQLLSCDFVVFTHWTIPDMRAPFWRLFWHDHPGVFFEIDGKRRPVPARRFVLIPPHTPLSCSNTATFGQLFMHFRLEPGLAGRRGEVYFAKPDAALDRLAVALRRSLQTHATTLDVSLRAQALLSLVLLTVPESHWAPRWDDSRITAAAAAIRSAYPRKLANNTLAQQAGLHPGAFIRLFRQTTGHTPGEFLANLRLEEACVLLHYSELSIDEVAAKIGFADRGYFSRQFAARIGIPPARYRKLVNTDNRLRR